jgi:hypothetical protein
MNDQDRDLILDLLGGRLGTEQAEAAAARLASDPELAAEFATQAAVQETLSSAEPVGMTAAERTSLRATLSEQLHVGDGVVASPQKKTRRIAWWQPVAGLAAAAAVVTAIVILPGSLSNDELNTVAAEISQSSDAPSLAPESGTTNDGVQDSGTGEENLFAPGEPVLVIDLSRATPADILAATEGLSRSYDIQNGLESKGYSGDLFLDGSALEACLVDLRPKLPSQTAHIHLLGAGQVGETTIVHLGLGSDGDTIDTVVSIDLADCSFSTAGNGLGISED